MTHIAFFGHNVTDAAVRRRAFAFERAGYRVSGFMMRRGAPTTAAWNNVDLGRSHDNAYWHRIRAISRGAKLATAHADLLRDADLIYARNLDMLACAHLVRRRLRLKASLVFECLDIHKRLTDGGFVAGGLQALERHLLKQTNLVVCSSPAFFSRYFDVHHSGQYRPYLLENRLIRGDAFPNRPSKDIVCDATDGDRALRIGWFGNLRCRRSLDLLLRVADMLSKDVHIDLRGYPAPNVFPDFEAEIAPFANVHFGGRYQAPQDLAEIYADVDVQWGGDFHEAGANSVWLLPNRLYEGGYFGTPLISPSKTQTAHWLEEHGGGFAVDEPLEDNLPELVAELCRNRQRIRQERTALLVLDDNLFVEKVDETKRLVAAALATDVD